jgi:hypothetical protein
VNTTPDPIISNVLDTSIPLVTLQFNFKNIDLIPEGVERVSPELPKQARERRHRNQGIRGVKILDGVENCSLAELKEQLEAAGYELFRAFVKRRKTGHDDHQVHYELRFEFAREVDDNESFDHESAEAAFEDFAGTCLWQVNAWNNPFFSDGEPIDGLRCITMMCNSRRPLLEKDGSPILINVRNADGEKTGEMTPLAPDWRLGVSEGGSLMATIVD